MKTKKFVLAAAIMTILALLLGCVFASSAPEVELNSAGSIDTAFASSGYILPSTAAAGEFDYVTGLAVLSDGKLVLAGKKIVGSACTGFLSLYSSDGKTNPATNTFDSVYLNGVATNNILDYAGTGTLYQAATGNDFAVDLQAYYSTSVTNPTTLVTTITTGYNLVTKTVDVSGGGFNDEATSIAYDSSYQRYFVAGSSETSLNGQTQFALAAFDAATLALDTTFGSGGIVKTDISATGNDVANALITSYDGYVVLGGKTDNGTSTDFALVKYNSTGTLDTGFGTGGIVTLDYSGDNTSNDSIGALLLQNSYQIIAVGTTKPKTSGKSSLLLARYYSYGTLDTNFGSNGIVKVTLGSYDMKVGSAALQSNGKIIVAGYFEKTAGTPSAPGQYEFFLARFTADGILDSTFGAGGYVTSSFNGKSTALPLAVTVNTMTYPNKIIAGGSAGSSTAMNAAAARYNIQ